MRNAIATLVTGVVLSTTASFVPAQETPTPVGRVTGIGGVFVESPDPRALAAWYRDVLGVPLEAWGGAVFRRDAPGNPAKSVWTAFPPKSKTLSPSTRGFMIDFAVDDLDALVERLDRKGVPILGRDDADPSGRFAWILDPDGTKIELWQPKAR